MDEDRLNHEEEGLGKVYDSRLMKRLLGFAKPYWLYFLVAVLVLLGSTLTDLAGPKLTQIAIDDYINGYTKPMVAYSESSGKEGIHFEGKVYQRVKNVSSETPAKDVFVLAPSSKGAYLVQGYLKKFPAANADLLLSKDTGPLQLSIDGQNYPARELSAAELDAFRQQDKTAVLYLALLFVLAIILGFVFNYLQVYFLSYAGQNIIFNLRQSIFTHLQRMPLQFFDRNPVGRLVTRVTNDTEALNEMYTNVLINILKDISILLGVIIVMFTMDRRLAWITVASIPLVVLLTAVFRVKIREVYRRVRVTLAKVNSALSENLSGMKVIQIFNRERENHRDFAKTNDDYFKATKKEITVFGIFRPLIELVQYIAVSFLIWFAGGDVLHGLLQFGVLYAFINYIDLFFHPINDLADKFNIMQSAMASSERIFLLMDTPEEEDTDHPACQDQQFKGDIEFKNVHFAYNEGEWVLRDVSFTVPAGKTVAIVGATGAGKTSIISLINRFYEIQSGEICIDGINIREISKETLRKNIGVVLQDVFLFSSTIKENIRLGEKEISDERIRTVSEYVNAAHFIDRLASGYDEMVAERGVTFSAGQRQLLAFARTLAFNPSILVLDEATANIDTETELLIQDALTKITRNRTTIVIAHRLSTIQHADSIIVLHKGKIREMGNHQELLANRGMYYNLYQLQYKG